MKNVFESYDGRIRENKKELYPNLVPANIQLFSLSVDAEFSRLPSLDVKKSWWQLIPTNFIFGDALSRVFKEKEYQQFGSIFEDWRKTTLIPANN